ncbi:MAG: hypothetical protein K6T75_09190 [Acetobacteraceae bacterium]|nr:hypothetical protein [Acetobacteraceae bacterium]
MALDEEDPVRRGLRGGARVVAVAAGVFWLIYGILSSSYEGVGAVGRLAEMSPGLVFLVTAAAAIRWELVGGALLVLEGLGTWCLLALSGGPLGLVVEVAALLGLPLVVAGALMVWLSRTEPGRHGQSKAG